MTQPTPEAVHLRAAASQLRSVYDWMEETADVIDRGAAEQARQDGHAGSRQNTTQEATGAAVSAEHPRPGGTGQPQGQSGAHRRADALDVIRRAMTADPAQDQYDDHDGTVTPDPPIRCATFTAPDDCLCGEDPYNCGQPTRLQRCTDCDCPNPNACPYRGAEAAAHIRAATTGPDGHRYLSTYCLHNQHHDCRRTCKTCNSPCVCGCHTDTEHAGTEQQVRAMPREQLHHAIRDLARTDRDWFHQQIRRMGRIDPAWIRDTIRSAARTEQH